jgi:hypothetical protein
MSRIAALLAFALFVPSLLSAATRTWTGAADANWSNRLNWAEGSAPAAGDDLVFGPSALFITAMTNDLPAGTALHSLTVGSSQYTINAGNPVVITGGSPRPSDRTMAHPSAP